MAQELPTCVCTLLATSTAFPVSLIHDPSRRTCRFHRPRPASRMAPVAMDEPRSTPMSRTPALAQDHASAYARHSETRESTQVPDEDGSMPMWRCSLVDYGAACCCFPGRASSRPPASSTRMAKEETEQHAIWSEDSGIGVQGPSAILTRYTSPP